MSTPNDPTGSHHDPIDAVIAEYLEQVEAGTVPDREALLAAHPDLAERLREFFTDFDRLDRQAGELRLNRSSDTEQPGEPARVRYFGDYELLEVIARGGMGVVYKARQTSLNRLVALKMILQGELATPRDVARFRAEAEAAANLDHPHIVPIYEVGEHNGQHYYAMRFVAGESLARQPRGDVRAEVGLLAAIARAVHYAHQHGILHRDLKPSNILLQTAEGGASAVPFITDFGLAKRLGVGGDLTRSGEAPGTPRYMAPEQAAGRKDLTVAADVYSLGVVLYERLTDTTPFTSDNALELYRQIREAEPPRPSGLRPGLDRDLETVCLKCLEKEPSKRYPSAEALAEDLERWLRGEAILARAVGPLGRLRRWCRRNPVVAGLTGAVALVLLAGIVTTTHFAVEADRRARSAQAAETRMEQALVRSLVRPMDARGDLTLSPMELEALWELAQNEPWLRSRFLTEMLGTEANVYQLRNRMKWVVHSAVGLDPQVRERAESVLLDRLNDPEKSLRHRTGIAWAVLELVDTGSPSQRAVVPVIAQGLAAEEQAGPLSGWKELLPDRAERMPPADAVALLAPPLLTATDPDLRRQLALALASAAGRLEPAEAARVCGPVARVLAEALGQEKSDKGRNHLAKALASVAARLEPAEAASVCGPPARSLTDAVETKADALLAESLALLLGHLEPAEAARLAGRATRALTEATNETPSYPATEGLVLVAAGFTPTEAVRVLPRPLGVLAGATNDDTGEQDPTHLDRGLEWVTSRLGTVVVVRALGEALAEEKNAGARSLLASRLASAVGRLKPGEAFAACAPAARTLAQALDKATDPSDSDYLCQGLVSLAERLEPNEAARLLGLALEKRVGSTPQQFQLAESLVSVTGRLAPAEAARACGPAARALAELLDKEEKPAGCAALADALAAVSGRLEPAEAVRLCSPAARALAEALHRENDPRGRINLAGAVASLAGRLEGTEAVRLCGAAAQVLAQTLEQEKDAGVRKELAEALASVTGRLAPAEAARVCDPAARALVKALNREKDASERNDLASALASVAGRLEPAEAARLCSPVARTLMQSLEKEKDPKARSSLTSVVASVTERLEPAEGTRVRVELVRSLTQRLKPDPRGDPFGGLEDHGLEVNEVSTLLQQLDGDGVEPVVRALARRIVASRNANSGYENSQGGTDTFPDNLNGLLTNASRGHVRRRTAALAGVAGIGSGGPLTVLRLLPAVAEPLPCRLATQDLVDLLKMPSCVGEVRRVILDHLGNRYGQRFATRWDFVRYAQEHQLNLDFTTPPQRPE